MVKIDRTDGPEEKADYRYFATIRGFADGKIFTDKASMNDESQYEKYNDRKPVSLQAKLKHLGFEYQKVSGVRENETEITFVVWNTAYRWEDFKRVMLRMNEMCKQRIVCIGRKAGGKYEVALFETASLENIDYYVKCKMESAHIADALTESIAVLRQGGYDKNRCMDRSKVQGAVKFEKLESNYCLAASRSMCGYYKRKMIIEELFKEKG